MIAYLIALADVVLLAMLIASTRKNKNKRIK